MRARILGLGSHVPERVVSNAELAARVDCSEQWIFERTGIRERRWVAEGSGVGSAALGIEAARAALAASGVPASDVTLVVFATLSPDYDFPGNSVVLAHALGLPSPATLEIRQQCNGFLYGLAAADAFLRTGAHRYALVVASEVQSTGLDVSARGRDMAVIFADGAGAAVLGLGSDEGPGILRTILHSDGAHAEALCCEGSSSRRMPRITAEGLAAGQHFPRMNGRLVFRHALEKLPSVIREVLAAERCALDEVDWLVPHQANLRIIENVRVGLAVPTEKVVVNIDRMGNTTAASIPLALEEARRDGRIRDGQLVCLAAFGAGFGWGATLLRF